MDEDDFRFFGGGAVDVEALPVPDLAHCRVSSATREATDRVHREFALALRLRFLRLVAQVRHPQAHKSQPEITRALLGPLVLGRPLRYRGVEQPLAEAVQVVGRADVNVAADGVRAGEDLVPELISAVAATQRTCRA